MNPRQLIDRQVARVRRRLTMRHLLESLAGYWAAGFLTCALWFLVRPFVTAPAATWAAYGIPAGIMIGATLAAVLWTIWRAPQRVSASLALDKEFGLEERVTTFTLLAPEQISSPAGNALLEDVLKKVTNLDVASRFPVGLRAVAGLMPLGAALLALAASFFDPSFSNARTQNNALENAVADPKGIQEQLDNLRKVVMKEKGDDDLPKSKELEELEKEWEKLVRKPLDPNNKEMVRERTAELAKLDDKIQKRVSDLKDKNAGMKKKLDQLLQDKLGKKLQPGAAKDLEDALAKGKFNKAREILEKLQKDLEDNKLNKEDLKKLAEQMEQLQEKLKRLTDQKEAKDKLQKDFDEGKISKEELDRELENLKQEAKDLQDLEELADLLGECKQCMGAGNNLKAGERLKAALEKLRGMELTDAELKKLLSDQKILKGACEGMCQACNGDCDANGKKNGMGKGKRPGGVRPVGEEPDSKILSAREKGDPDPTGQQFITGFSRGGSFKKIPAKEVGGAFQRAAQDSSEAIERQRIPAEAEGQVKGYFEKLGRQR